MQLKCNVKLKADLRGKINLFLYNTLTIRVEGVKPTWKVWRLDEHKHTIELHFRSTGRSRAGQGVALLWCGAGVRCLPHFQITGASGNTQDETSQDKVWDTMHSPAEESFTRCFISDIYEFRLLKWIVGRYHLIRRSLYFLFYKVSSYFDVRNRWKRFSVWVWTVRINLTESRTLFFKTD